MSYQPNGTYNGDTQDAIKFMLEAIGLGATHVDITTGRNWRFIADFPDNTPEAK